MRNFDTNSVVTGLVGVGIAVLLLSNAPGERRFPILAQHLLEQGAKAPLGV
jgi:hypothetical protein